MLALAERALAPLDHVRSVTLRALGRRGRVLFASRDARVLLFAATAAATTFALTMVAPIWLLALGPVVLGVPHLVADARYLVARPGLHRRPLLVAAVGVPAAATWIWPSAALALIGVAAVAVVARGSWPRRAIVLLVGGAVAIAADHFGYAADLVLAHAHNLIAFALWWLVAPRSVRHVVPIALVALGVAAIFAMPATAPTGDLDEFVRALSPVGATAWGVKLVLAFAFLQSAHYAVWLRLVPEDARERTGIRSFAHTLRALVRDLGGWLVAAAIVAAAAMIAYGLVDARAARLGYLRAAYAHGFVELAVLALVFVEGTQVLRHQRGRAP
jgi:hypothetical protein